MVKIVVIGANHAGTACINTILDNYTGHELVVFDSNFNISFLGCGIALWIGNQINDTEGLFYSNAKILEDKGAKVYMETMVSSIDYERKLIIATEKNGTIHTETYDKLVIATGSLPIIPRLEGSSLGNVQKVKLYQDAEAVIQKLDSDPSIQNVSVIGAGYIGVELVEAFKMRGKRVTLVDMAATCLPTYYDDKFTDLMCRRLEKNGVRLKFSQSVIGFEGDTKVRGVKTREGVIPTDLAVWAIGFRPNNMLGKTDLKLARNGAIIVDAQQRTSMKDVYAIGDCATVLDNSLGGLNYIALATNAVRSGIVAGHNVCGTAMESQGVQGSNALSVFGLNLVSTGLTMAKAKEAGIDATCTDYSGEQRPSFMRTNSHVDLRIVFEKRSRRIIGTQIASEHDISMLIHMFSLAIQEHITIDRLKLLDMFFLPHFNQPYNYVSMAAIQAPDTM